MKFHRAAVFAVVILAVIGLDRGPLPWPDEVCYAEPARVLAAEGRLAALMLGSVRGLSAGFIVQPPVGLAERAGWFALFGFSQTVNRLAGIAEFVVSLLLLGAILRALRQDDGKWSNTVIWFVALLAAGEAGVQEAFHSGRPDFVAIDL